MNYGWILFMFKYELWVNMNYEWIWIMGEYHLWVHMNYGWTLGWSSLLLGGGGGGGADRQTDRTVKSKRDLTTRKIAIKKIKIIIIKKQFSSVGSKRSACYFQTSQPSSNPQLTIPLFSEIFLSVKAGPVFFH